MPRLFTVDREGEYWLDNPQLVIANPKKKGRSTMPARRRAGKRRRARRNYYGAGLVAANRPSRNRRRRSPRANTSHRRRSYRRNMYPPFYAAANPRRRRRGNKRYRRNPAGSTRLFGFSMPPLDAVAYTGVGVIVPPILTGYVMPMLPANWQTDGVRWIVRIASVLVPPFLLGGFLGTRARNFMLIGGGAGLALDLIRTFAPGVIPGLGAQPLLGAYFTRPNNGGMLPYGRPRQGQPPIIASVPERLSPASRF